jgi:hypothetical protein
LEGVRGSWLNMSGFCGLDRNMLGCVEIIEGAGLPLIVPGQRRRHLWAEVSC